MNLAFSDYFVPVQLDREAFRNKLYSEGMEPELSIVACEGEQVVGLILHAVDRIDGTLIAWNGGKGVIPQQRRRGIARQMHLFGLERLVESGVQQVMLEVIDRNEQAIQLYRQSEYSEIRSLLCYQGLVDPNRSESLIDIPKGGLRPIEAKQLAGLLSWRSHEPAWQNGDLKLDRIEDNVVSWSWSENGQIIAWARTDRDRPGLLYQCGISPDASTKAASRMLAALSLRSAGLVGMLNVDERDRALNEAFTKLGLAPYLRQVEMRWMPKV
jgi:GNAT superfamily N-acetyltransferase